MLSTLCRELYFGTGSDLPKNIPEGIAEIVRYIPELGSAHDLETYDYMANTRVLDKILQSQAEMEFEEGLKIEGTSLNSGTPISLDAHISVEEFGVRTSLSDLLGYSIFDDTEEPGGLRLVEWVRGYASLKVIAHERSPGIEENGDGFAIVLTINELVKTLVWHGLTNNKAHKFIELTCLHKASRDIYDCPLIRLINDKLILFAPTIYDIVISTVVLSNLSSRRIQLGKKGKAFERTVLNTLRTHGFAPFAFKANREGEEFEYDAVLPWDGRIFVFECKNNSLSGNDPVQAYYFDLAVKSQVKQVRRLSEALEKYPDIISQKMDPKYKSWDIVPCVLHSLPYSRQGDIDGVYFTDFSSLSRFFSEKYFQIKNSHSVGEMKILHRVAIKEFWANDEPSVDDFLEQLKNPFQLELFRAHLKEDHTAFCISETQAVYSTDYRRSEMTPNSICEAVGIDPKAVDKKLEGISGVASEIRKKQSDRDNS